MPEILGSQTSNASMRDVFGEGAKPYLKLQEAYGTDLSKELVRLLKAKLPDGKPRILDVGCGVGEPSMTIVENFPEASVTATDLSPRMLDVAKEYCASKKISGIEFQVADAQDLSAFATASFDAIVSIATLFIVPDPLKAVREFKRVLKPGGVAVIQTWSRDHDFSESMMWAVDRVLDVKEQKPVLFPLSDPSQFEKLFRDGGFSEVNVSDYLMPVTITRQNMIESKDHPASVMMGARLIASGKVDKEEAWPLYRDAWLKVAEEKGYLKDQIATFPDNLAYFAIATA